MYYETQFLWLKRPTLKGLNGLTYSFEFKKKKRREKKREKDKEKERWVTR